MSWILDAEKNKMMIRNMLKSFIGGQAEIIRLNRRRFICDIFDISTSNGSMDIEFGSLKTRLRGKRKWQICNFTEMSVTLKNKSEVEHDNSEDGRIVIICLEDGDLYLTKKGYAGNVKKP